MATRSNFSKTEDEGHGFHDYCGIFGIYGRPQASTLAYLGLYALQHRGQESAGIVVSNGRKIKSHVRLGLVADAFQKKDLEKLPGHQAIGHVRYSTRGSSSLKNAQPIFVETRRGLVALAHNGNLTNATELRRNLEEQGSIFQTTTDSEPILHLMAKSDKEDFTEALVDSLKKVKGAYSVLLMNRDKIVAVRDPHGFRPLSIGHLGKATVFASESCAFDIIDATYERSLKPGEVVVVDEKGTRSFFPFEKVPHAQCIFEYVYFARPDSFVFGKGVHEIRKEFGRILAREHPSEADIVVPVPDSANVVATGYSEISKIPMEIGMIRNHYVGRIFIEPDQRIRDFGAKIKFNAARDAIKGKRIVVVDDSIVRGTNARKIVKMFRLAGAKEIHFRISSPPIINSCHYGIDTPNRDKLIAANKSVDEIKKFLEVDSLEYLSVEGMLSAIKKEAPSFCTACFTGNYPVPIQKRVRKREFERHR